MSRTNRVLSVVPNINADERIPLVRADLPTFEELTPAFKDILASGKISNFGKFNTQFETDAGKYLGCETATVSSGTMGLIFSLQALGVKPGDKVLVPSFTFMATVQAILYCGGTPIFTEIEDDMTVLPSDVEAQLKKHPEVGFVIGIHSYGLPARVNEIEAIVTKREEQTGKKIKVLYDAAHAFGSALNGRKVGTFGDAEVFSLSVTKALVSIEGGMICSKNPEFIARIRKMRNYGIESNYNTHYPGANGKMSEFHAVFGVLNLKHLDDVLATRKEKAAYYTTVIETETNFSVMRAPAGVIHTFKDFTIKLSPEMKKHRDAICKFLDAEGIDNRAYFFPPVHEQEFFKKYADRPLPKTEDLSRRVITLPFFTTITKEQMDRVASVLKKAEAKFGKV